MWAQIPNLARLAIIVIGGVVGLRAGVKYITRKKVFISFAIEDKSARDLLVGQSRNENTQFGFVDMSVKEPWSNAWKTQCRERIKACHGVIVLISKNTLNADGVHWEIKCAKDEGLPVKMIYARKDAKGCKLPEELKGQHVYKWSWLNINRFVDELK
ncbi:MAG: TIR domain-containing protein [Bacteroidetes bacterium]|nr:TIR domain-containing protein [Bacteroidota bacterium]